MNGMDFSERARCGERGKEVNGLAVHREPKTIAVHPNALKSIANRMNPEKPISVFLQRMKARRNRLILQKKRFTPFLR